MALLAPMISEIARHIFDHTHAYISELLGTPESLTADAFMLSGGNCTPIRQAKRDVIHLHGLSHSNVIVVDLMRFKGRLLFRESFSTGHAGQHRRGFQVCVHPADRS